MNDETETLILDCKMRYKKLNSWENDFIDSIEQQYRTKKFLTQNQEETLNKLWEKATS
jgi:hypothetical protein